MKDLERATGVGREAIRFYIREGLLPEPQRPARNVAYYDAACVERIQFIKDLQHKRYLPLHVIKAIVAGETPPSRDEAEALLALDGKLFDGGSADRPAPRERLADIAARLGLSVREILEIADCGAIEVRTADGDRWLQDASVRLLEIWARLRAAGFTDDLGFTTTVLRLYVDTFRLLAGEEAAIFSRGVAGRVPIEKAARMAELGIELGNHAIAVLRKQAILQRIATGNRPASEPQPSDADVG